MRCCPAVHCAPTVVAHFNRVAAVAISHCDNQCHPSPPPLPITIMLPSYRPWRCCPLQLCCYGATLCHLLTCRRHSTSLLVVTSGWLSSRHLLSCHRLSRLRLIVTSPLDAQPSILPQLLITPPRCRPCPSMRQLVVTLPLIAPPSCLPHLVVPAPLIASPSLNTSLLQLIKTGVHVGGGGCKKGGGDKNAAACPDGNALMSFHTAFPHHAVLPRGRLSCRLPNAP